MHRPFARAVIFRGLPYKSGSRSSGLSRLAPAPLARTGTFRHDDQPMTRSSDALPAPDFLAHDGEAAALLRAHDWRSSPLGPPDAWPEPLKTLVGVMLGSNQPMFVAWGPERIMIYNDVYAPLCGARHPEALGRPFAEVWHDVQEEMAPIMDRAFTGTPVNMTDIHLVTTRHGRPEEAHFAFSYTPVRTGRGVDGVFCICTETTEQVLADRQRAFVLALEDYLRNEISAENMKIMTAELLGRQVGAARAGYGEIDEAGTTVIVNRDWTSGMGSLAGKVRLLDAFGPQVIAELRAGRTLVVEDCRTDPRAGSAHAAAWDSIGTRALIVVPLVRDGRLRAILYLHEAVPRRWTDLDAALAEAAAERTWSAVERARAEAALRESEARFRNLADHTPVMIWVTDANARCIYVNRPWYDFTGMDEAGSLGFGWINAIHPDERAEAERMVMEAKTAQAPFRIEYRLRRADGAYRWVINAASPRFGPDGAFLGYVGSVIDIDERREAEARQTLLAREVDHRAKNALAVVQAVVRLTRAENPADFLEAVEKRVAALARAHSLLAEGQWSGARLEVLAAAELAPYAGKDRSRVRLSGPPAVLAADAVQPTAMVLHELSTNAAKYGALSAPGGGIDLSWRIEPDGSLRLDWHEVGGPAVPGTPVRRGFGSQMVRAAATQLGGAAAFEWDVNGLRCSLTISSAHLAATDTVNGPRTEDGRNVGHATATTAS